MIDAIDDIPILSSLSDDERAWIAEHSSELVLQRGDILFNAGDRDDRFYIVLKGELQVVRTVKGIERVVGVHPRGDMGGELALLQGIERSASAKAIKPTRLLMFDEPTFRSIFTAVPSLGMTILRTAAERLSGNASRITHDEKLAALGKFSAGLAHEINNPAAAAMRAAQTMDELLPRLLKRSMQLCMFELDTTQLERLLAVEDDLAARRNDAPSLSPLEQSDREDQLTDWLEAIGVEDATESAPVFVASGIILSDLQAILQEFPDTATTGIAQWLGETLNARSLLCEIDDTTTRISELVRAVKEFTHLDHSRVQETDIHKGLDTTLKVLAHKLKDTEVVREYDPEMPTILANDGELNQVWTNLIDNALDAVKDNPQGRIEITTRCENDFVMVTVRDNGKGISSDVLPHIFEPFFTTKGIGEGTGLGLDISFRIISQHEGTIEAESAPGNTVFTVRLPVKPKAASKDN